MIIYDQKMAQKLFQFAVKSYGSDEHLQRAYIQTAFWPQKEWIIKKTVTILKNIKNRQYVKYNLIKHNYCNCEMCSTQKGLKIRLNFTQLADILN